MSRRNRLFGLNKPQYQTQYAPPPGPPPDWPQWQTPGSSTSPGASAQNGSGRSGRSRDAQLPVISHEDEVKRISKACVTAKGNAQLLQETLLYTKAEDLKQNSLIEEFLDKCRKSQEQIASNIPWASYHAEKSHSSVPNNVETKEERLLAELLATNEQLLDALNMYKDLEEQGEREQERAERRMRAMDAITTFTPTPAESALVDRIFAIADVQNTGTISPDAARRIFLGSNLPSEALEEIWEIANVEENPTYGKYCVGIAVRLVGHLQNGAELSEKLVSRAGPLAEINGLQPGQGGARDPFADPASRFLSHSPPSTFSAPPTMPEPTTNLPPLTEQDIAKFLRIFQSGGPENGVLSAKRAGELLLKSRLSVDTLGQIWDLADINKRGELDPAAFTIAMYLVQGCMSGQLKTVPSSLPQSLYAQAGLSSSPHAVLDAHYGSPGPSSPAPVAMPAPQPAGPPEPSLIDLDDEPSPSLPMPMPIPTVGGTPLTPIAASPPPGLPPPTPSSPASPFNLRPGISSPWRSPSRSPSASVSYLPTTSTAPIPEGWNWDVSPADKANSDKFFDTLDPWKHGYIEGEAAVAFLSKSKLPPAVLAEIWDLADVDHDGHLTKEEFAIAMYLIRGKLAGKEIPAALPPSLIPPANLAELEALAALPAEPPRSPVVAAPVAPQETAARSSTPPPPYDENAAIPNATP